MEFEHGSSGAADQSDQPALSRVQYHIFAIFEPSIYRKQALGDEFAINSITCSRLLRQIERDRRGAMMIETAPQCISYNPIEGGARSFARGARGCIARSWNFIGRVLLFSRCRDRFRLSNRHAHTRESKHQLVRFDLRTHLQCIVTCRPNEKLSFANLLSCIEFNRLNLINELDKIHFIKLI